MNSLIKEVKTQRKESLTEMDVLPHSTDVFEGPTHEEAIEGVKIRMEVEECVEDIIRGVQDILYLELCAE